ncbi:MAG: 4Fe-4S dicluster domain-containing protein [Ignavibacteria bacterium]|nr:4Fe-4S dicluster domain-containing protein [Ignavibacteria bacterium]
MNELTISNIILIISGELLFFFMMIFSIFSLKEKESKAASRALLLAIILPIPYLLIALIAFPFQKEAVLFLIILTALVLIVLFFPTKRFKVAEKESPEYKYDERDIVFSRRHLKTETERYDEYYSNHHDKKKPDDNFRSKPGLLSPESNMYNPFTFASASASFIAVSGFHDLVDGDVSDTKVESDPLKISNYIKNWSKKLGALNTGITELKEYHKYSHAGRRKSYGEPVILNHKFAIAFTVEMDKYQVGCAPAGPTVMESAQQYFESGAVAVQVAAFIRNLGYPARAHIDGNYQVLCPLIARDAGLGEIGRMGLLMTPNLGPRVRISVVTTDLPLVIDDRNYEHSTIDFCEKCRKCAVNCPPKAISFDSRKEINGVSRWKIDSEACYTYWCVAGTDCAKCMSVCPYSHPDNMLHNFVRAGIRNSSVFRKFAVMMDDFFYGKKPKSLEILEWMRIDNEK